MYKHCKLYLTLIIAAAALFAAHTVYADTPQLENEPFFNKAVSDIASGSFSLNPADIIKYIQNLFTKEIRESGSILITLICIGTAASVIGMFDTFSSKETANAAFFACFTAVCTAALGSFLTALRYASSVIEAMTDFITKFSPLLTVMLLSSGHAASAGVFHPVLSGAVYILSLIVKKWLIPLIAFETVLSIISRMNDTISITGFCKLIHSLVKWILAASFTLFTGICSIYGFTTPALDVLGAKAVKFAVGSLVPVVGGFLSDSMETVISGGQMMKNAVGGAGLAVMCVTCCVPVIKLAVICLMLKLGAAVIEPISDKRISGMLWSISSSVMQLFGMVIVIAVLFMICISIILSSTNSVI